MKSSLPTRKQVIKFCKEEQQDWMLLRQASHSGDEDATLALALFRCLNHELDEITEKLENTCTIDDKEYRNILIERMSGLLTQRRAILYEDYKIQDKRAKIFLGIIERDQDPNSINQSIN